VTKTQIVALLLAGGANLGLGVLLVCTDGSGAVGVAGLLTGAIAARIGWNELAHYEKKP
jgi:hypothetical protein